MIVIDVLRIVRLTDRTEPALHQQHLVELSLTDAVTVAQVVLAGAAM